MEMEQEMSKEDKFTHSGTDDERGDELEFGDNDEFQSVPTDRTNEVDDEEDGMTEDTIEDSLISSFRRRSEVADGNRDEAFSYLQEIARKRLLTPEEEKELFQQFEAGRQKVTALLAQLPLCILERVRPKTGRRRGAKQKETNGIWWSPMHVATLLEQIQKEIKVYQKQLETEIATASNNPGKECKRLTNPEEALSKAVQTIQAIQDAQLEIKEIKVYQKQPETEIATASNNPGKECKRLTNLEEALSKAVQTIQDAQLEIVERNLLLVASIAKQHNFNKSSLSFLDLMQEGSVGLMKAVEKFDLARGYRFSTYATWWIMQAIKRALDQQSQTIRIPCYVGETRRSIKQAQSELAKDLEREPGIKDVAEAVGMPESRVIEILQSTKGTISLDSPLSESSPDATISDLLADDSQVTPEEELLSNSEKESLERVLDTLAEREKLVIKLRYGLTDGTEHTLAEIGRKLEISRERVRQIEDEALRKLRHHTRVQYLQELL